LITSAERIAVENKGFRGLGTKNGSYRKIPRDLVSRSGGLAFQRGSRRIFHRALNVRRTYYITVPEKEITRHFTTGCGRYLHRPWVQFPSAVSKMRLRET